MGYVEYDEDVLKHIKQVELIILKDFIDICEENNLEYFAYGGTALGALRHGGFIPWDDDIDVIMFRDDYEKFCDIMKTKINDKYKLLNEQTEEEYFFFFSKLMLKDTNLEEWWVRQVNFYVGIYIDIFVFDNIPNNNIKRFFITKTCRILDKLSTLSLIKIENYPKNITILLDLVHHLLKFFRLKHSFFRDKCLSLMKRYNNEPTDLICDFSAIGQPEIYNKKDFCPPKKMKFENLEIKVPNNIDNVLTHIYGDYMKLPPKEERHNHPMENINFGKY